MYAAYATPTSTCQGARYQRRRPERSTLYTIVAEHAETVFAEAEASSERGATHNTSKTRWQRTFAVDSCSLGRQSRTKYIIRNAPERVTITRRHHPLQGQSFEVLMEGRERLTVALSDGTSMRILRQWTDADGVDTTEAREGIYTTESLRRLIALIEALAGR